MGRRKKSDLESITLTPEVIEGENSPGLERGDVEAIKVPKVIDRSLLKAPINEWVETPEEAYLTYDVKKCYIPFDRILQIPKLKIYNTFIINKDSYSNQLPIICRYVNFFIHEYDKEHELLMAYLSIKFSIDNEEGDIYFHGEDQLKDFIDYVYETMFTESIISKIHQLVEENYLDDIESDDGSKKYLTKEKKHLESLEFTNEHIKTLLKISFGIKMLTPVVFHYLGKNKIIVNKTTDHLYNAFRGLFKIFNQTCDMYNKLFVYVNA